MSFKPGDKVIVIDGPQKGESVYTVYKAEYGDKTYPLRIVGCVYTEDGRYLSTGPVCLRYATPKEIKVAENPLRRGDLVKVQGYIGIVSSEGPDVDGDYTIALLTGEENTVAYERGINVKRVGSIRKKVKRLKAQMGGVK